MSIPFWHPAITTAYKANRSAPLVHPDVHANLSSLMPARHPNITALILNPGAKPLPADHPAIEPWIGNLSRPAYTPYRVSLPFWHVSVESSYRAGVAAPAVHPDVHANLSGACVRACVCGSRVPLNSMRCDVTRCAFACAWVQRCWRASCRLATRT